MKVKDQIRDMKAYLDAKRENDFAQEEVYELVLIHINSKVENYTITYKKGKGDLRPLIKKVGPKFIMEAADVSAEQYLEYENNLPTEDSVINFYNKIGGIAYNKSMGIEF